jgi:hypothetical protein
MKAIFPLAAGQLPQVAGSRRKVLQGVVQIDQNQF